MNRLSPAISSSEAEREALLEAAKLMLIAARTAPKSGGIDDVLLSIAYGREKDAIADKMNEIAESRRIEGFKRDAKNVRDSEAIIIVGVRGNKSFGLNCGACGYKSCSEFNDSGKRDGEDFGGPTCLFKALDIGIALGSAARMAGELNVDNRIMYRIGAAAMKLGMMTEATVIIGIPISAKGKSIYFDRNR